MSINLHCAIMPGLTGCAAYDAPLRGSTPATPTSRSCPTPTAPCLILSTSSGASGHGGGRHPLTSPIDGRSSC